MNNVTKAVFIKTIAELVQKWAPVYGISICSPIIAQACKESAFGTSELAKVNNFFGLKFKPNRCPGASLIPYYKYGSEQNADGSYTNSAMAWFQFDSVEQGVKGYFDFINISRYSNLKGVTDAKTYCDLLKSDGYATSLTYATSLYNDYIIPYNLTQYDKKEEPKPEKKTIRIMLDAGHDNFRNQSPVFPIYNEATFAWKLQTYLKSELAKYGFVVGTTRTSQTIAMDVVPRGKASQGYDLFLSLHSNACGTESVDRVEAIYMCKDNSTNIDEKSAEIATILANVVKNTMQTSQNYKCYSKADSTDRNGDGMLNDNYYGVLHGARLVNTPGIILEHSFHTNYKAAVWLYQEDNIKLLAANEAKALADYYGLTETNSNDVSGYNLPFRIRVIKQINILKSASLLASKAGSITGGVFTIVDVSGNYGKLKSGAGWVNLNAVEIL